jgi:sarcosine oxidase subunit alpha
MRLTTGGRINRTRPLDFTFDGRPMQGFEGDTLASALIANGVHLVGRSFKYHRPRGFLGAGIEEPNALVDIDRGGGRTEPNVLATTVSLYDGLKASSQNRWPSLGFDLGALNGALSPFLAAGFYYKTFLWPRKAWHALYEPVIRSMAGLGRAPAEADPDHYAFRFAHCDVLVVGAGPAGLAAALAASEDGRTRVMICDEQSEPGGALLSSPKQTVEGQPAWDWLEDAIATLNARPNVRVMPRTTAFAYNIGDMVELAERLTDHLSPADASGPRQRRWEVRAKQVVLATGAHERPLVFADNDRPGIMLANAGRTWLNRYGALAGRKVSVCAAHDSAYDVSADLALAGAEVALFDARGEPAAPVSEAARAAGVEVLAGRPVGSRGGLRVSGLKTDNESWRASDLVLMAGGWTPAVHLHRQSGGKIEWNEALQAHLPTTAAQASQCAGAVRGLFASDACVADGLKVGLEAARAAHVGEVARTPAPTGEIGSGACAPLLVQPHTPDRERAKAFVDFQNDVTAKDVRLAVREGFRSVEHIKRYTTTGMATDQGRTSNLNALAAAGEALGVGPSVAGTTTFRPPYTPTTFGTWVGYGRGRLFDPERRTPMDGWAEANGAVFEPVAQWRRARYYPRPGEDMYAAVNRECRTVRQAAGLFDASTLGKIEVVGPDAAEFLNRFYINAWTKLEPGRCRYGVLLREDGYIMDDGVIGRLAHDRFHVTTTTGGAAGVMNMMEDYLQTEWPELKVWLTSTSEQWAVIAVQGPRARDMLAPLVEGIDLSAEAFPHMSLKLGRICGVETRLFRVSFTGELGFEVNVPAEHGRAVWDAIQAEGQKHGAVTYGTEAMHVLRAEKGYVIIGQDTDGTVSPDDAGLAWAIGKTKPDFVGKRSLARRDLVAPGRRQLVGLTSKTVLDEGAQLIPDAEARAWTAIGHVTSAYWSETLGRPIALALLADGRARKGETVWVTETDGRTVAATVCDPVFFDPKGERLDG